MTVSTGIRAASQRRGNVYRVPTSNFKKFRVQISFMDGDHLKQYHCGGFQTQGEARAAAEAVRVLREKLRADGYLPEQKQTGRPKKT